MTRLENLINELKLTEQWLKEHQHLNTDSLAWDIKSLYKKKLELAIRILERTRPRK